MRLIGVDVGGTFTDLVFSDTETGQTAVHKVPTTPDDPSRGVMAGITELCAKSAIAARHHRHVFHGTTIATNAVLEYKGARDRHDHHRGLSRHHPYRPASAAAALFDHAGNPLAGPPAGQAPPPQGGGAAGAAARRGAGAARRGRRCAQAARELRDEGVEAVAICFLFSYLNPAHEARAKEIVREEYPECFVTTSSSVVAAVPRVRALHHRGDERLHRAEGAPLRRPARDRPRAEPASRRTCASWRSNGGVATPAMVAERPVLTLLSGPAAGVLGGAWAGELSGQRNLITFDIGGTSADIGIVTDGSFGEATARDTWIAGFPLLVPMIDIHTIGAGGGSIAYRRPRRRLPRRPAHRRRACPARRPTAAAARADRDRRQPRARPARPRNFLGGGMRSTKRGAPRDRRAGAASSGSSEREAAEGILTIINTNMANAIRSRTVQKGIDPRGFALVAFGGAGPLHGAEVAEMLGIPEVIVPPYPGITSAMGLLTTDLKYDAIRTVFQVSAPSTSTRINRDFAAMEQGAGRAVRCRRHRSRQGHLRAPRRSALCRPGLRAASALPGRHDRRGGARQGLRGLPRVHRREYGHVFADSPIEIVNMRVSGVGRCRKIAKPTRRRGGSSRDEALVQERRHAPSASMASSQTIDTPSTAATAAGRRDASPVRRSSCRRTSTTVVPPGCTIRGRRRRQPDHATEDSQ